MTDTVVSMNTRIECTNRVIDQLLNPYYELIEHTASYGRKIARDSKSQKRPLVEFQRLLERIPNWDISKREEVFNRYCNNLDYDELTENLTRAFISHAKLYSPVQTANPNQRIDLNVPDNTTFFYESLIDIARDCWEKAYLMNKRGTPTEIQQRIQSLKELIRDSIQKTVRRLVPGAIVITPVTSGGEALAQDQIEEDVDDQTIAQDEDVDDEEDEEDDDVDNEEGGESEEESEVDEDKEVDVKIEMNDEDKSSEEVVQEPAKNPTVLPGAGDQILVKDTVNPSDAEPIGDQVVSEVEKVEDSDQSGSGDDQIAIEFDAVTPYERKKLSQLAGMATGGAKKPETMIKDLMNQDPVDLPVTATSDKESDKNELFIDLNTVSDGVVKDKSSKPNRDDDPDLGTGGDLPRISPGKGAGNQDSVEDTVNNDEGSTEGEPEESEMPKGGRVITDHEYQQFQRLKEMYKRKKQQKQMQIVEKLVKKALAKEQTSRPMRQVKKKKGGDKCLIDM